VNVYLITIFDAFFSVVAVLLGCLRMTAPEANEWLIKIGKSLFPKKGKCDKDMSNLKKILEEILEKRNFPPEIAMTDSRLQNPVSKCKVCVVFNLRLFISRIPIHSIAYSLLLGRRIKRSHNSFVTTKDVLHRSIVPW
jgi:hypothetical protein